MLYLNEKNIKTLHVDWLKTIDVIKKAVLLLDKKDFAQPIKPYLRYRDLTNRIIAMPAFIGGDFDMAGIKWIASFPQNIEKSIPRAHSVILLNNSETGQPLAVINTALLSIIRTASVSGLIIKYYQEVKRLDQIKVGICGFGPIGQYHLDMVYHMLKDNLKEINIYDLKPIDLSKIENEYSVPIKTTKNWEEAYQDADIFITCTVSKERYINQKPKTGSLQLNVSLRDYQTEIFEYVNESIIVDDWDEICRENTDIENFHIEKGLIQEQTKSLIDVVTGSCMNMYSPEQPIMFNPMGMGVFDMAIASYYYQQANEKNIGKLLD